MFPQAWQQTSESSSQALLPGAVTGAVLGPERGSSSGRSKFSSAESAPELNDSRGKAGQGLEGEREGRCNLASSTDKLKGITPRSGLLSPRCAGTLHRAVGYVHPHPPRTVPYAPSTFLMGEIKPLFFFLCVSAHNPHQGTTASPFLRATLEEMIPAEAHRSKEMTP